MMVCAERSTEPTVFAVGKFQSPYISFGQDVLRLHQDAPPSLLRIARNDATRYRVQTSNGSGPSAWRFASAMERRNPDAY